ncbi:Down syndrome cell adhesion molecule-like protein Dscam2 [Leptotrombidium deliense]|uniref:Down syndrome cell adhesion molecule-like protein Dscam2 n=1 Tax=Leptotrombidium deliense TaxID=299467 RepID=A0A443R6N7_9ACAR|nr:Down syndrome cell adhesion molecule-like protein Dscam2 [Leptotrombidium deliense]
MFKLLFVYVCLSVLRCSFSNIIKAPVISPVVNERVFNENSEASIICAVETGSEPFSFQWFKNRNPISDHQTKKIKITKTHLTSHLHFQNIAIENEGNYTCVVRNEFGSDSIYILVGVKVAPKWTVEPKDVGLIF